MSCPGSYMTLKIPIWYDFKDLSKSFEANLQYILFAYQKEEILCDTFTTDLFHCVSSACFKESSREQRPVLLLVCLTRYVGAISYMQLNIHHIP